MTRAAPPMTRRVWPVATPASTERDAAAATAAGGRDNPRRDGGDELSRARRGERDVPRFGSGRGTHAG